jgi:hypothetical protein
MTEKMRSNAKFYVIFVLILTAVLVGEVYIYTFNTDQYTSDVSISGNTVSFEVTSSVSTTYSIVISDNGDFEPNVSYYIYYDYDYGSMVNSVEVPVGARAFTEDYYISQLLHMLENRGITNVTILNAQELKEQLLSDTMNGTCNMGLIVLSGALPDTIYTGNGNDPIFEWLGGGGRLYWAGNLLGRYVATPGSTTDLGADNNYQKLFFGTECLNTGEDEKAYSDVTENEYRNTLSLMDNDIIYAADASKLPSALQIGYTNGTYSSTLLTAYGTNGGMICVIGGDYSTNQRNDLAHLISSGIGPNSVMVGFATGPAGGATRSGTIDVSIRDGSNAVAYVYFGGYFPIYGKLTELIP